MKVLIVVDMQNDFIDGALGTAEAQEIVPNVVEKIKKFKEEGAIVLYTRDTHQPNYLNTQEGRNLPVEHCIEGTDGWQLRPEIAELVGGSTIINKPTFGSDKLLDLLRQFDWMSEDDGSTESVTLVGLCTDICVISNAIIAKAALPEVPIIIDAACCAGVTPESHNQALEAMKVCQIQVI